MNQPETTFRTKDLNQAAFVWCQPGAKLKNVQGSRERGNTIFFIFTLPIQEEDLAALQISYANGDTQVEPQQFCAKQNNLRDLLHSSLGLQESKREKG
jgi:hypothetical protein